jgi:hypothetical protein
MGSAGSSASASASADTTSARSSSSKAKSTDSMKKDVLRRCGVSSSTTSYAILTDDGNFYKLDDSGAQQVKSNKWGKNTKVTVNGSVSGDTLSVQSMNKM